MTRPVGWSHEFALLFRLYFDVLQSGLGFRIIKNRRQSSMVNLRCEDYMKLLLAVVCFCFAMTYSAYSAAAPQTFPTAVEDVRITPLYHASTLIEAGGKTIYLDPAKPTKFAGLPKADLILITDIHGDHMDPASVAEIRKPGTDIMAPPAVVATVTAAKPIANHETKKWEGWTIEAIPAYNITRGPGPGKLFHDKGRGNGYVLTYGGVRFYFSGDTEGIPEMRALKNIDVAFVCMNLPYTMPPEEAAEAVKAFHPKVVIPYHYRGSDLAVFKKGLEGTGIEVRLLDWYSQ
jgi:L-ascorbate metabolism protein UlaG (beta-lactamase superfamily)